MCNFPSGNFPKVSLGQALRIGWARGPRAAAIIYWGPSAASRTYLGNCTFGKLPLGKMPLGKNLTYLLKTPDS